MRHVELPSPTLGAAGNVAVYGHYGRPVLAFPAEGGSAWDWDGQGMVGAVGPLLHDPDAFDFRSDIRAVRHHLVDRHLPLDAGHRCFDGRA